MGGRGEHLQLEGKEVTVGEELAVANAHCSASVVGRRQRAAGVPPGDRRRLDGWVVVDHEFGRHPVEALVVVPLRNEGAEDQPEDQSETACDPGTRQSGGPASIEVEDRANPDEDLPERLEAGDEPQESGERFQRHGPPEEASARYTNTTSATS